MARTIENSTLLMGQMMSQPLLISGLLAHAARHHADTEIVSRRTEGDIHRYTYADCHLRAKQVAQMLDRMQVEPSARIGTFAWNGYRHLEIYYGASGSARVCHTINPRLFADQLRYIVNHAEDQVIFFDTTFLPLIETIHAQCPTVRRWICLADADKMPQSTAVNIECYETLLAMESGDYEWPTFDERAASSLCYTSGTTGNPKGALYSHRSTILHSYAVALPDSLGITAKESIMPVVPMFHVNACLPSCRCAYCISGAKARWGLVVRVNRTRVRHDVSGCAHHMGRSYPARHCQQDQILYVQTNRHRRLDLPSRDDSSL